MAAYADSSLLLKLYLREPDSPAALAAVGQINAALWFTPLHRLEITNAIRRNAASGKVRLPQAVRAMRLLRQDLRQGRYTLAKPSWEAVFRRAHRLSAKHARTVQVRSLDLLHVAAALEVGATDFLSFDDRQRRTAAAEGLNVMP
jgi:predicted nucleic acid-binding protein